MQPSLDIRRHNGSSIDFDFYRRRASRRRRLAKRMVFEHYRSTIGKAAKASVSVIVSPLTLLSLRYGDLRPILRAIAIAIVLLAVAVLHARAQGESLPMVLETTEHGSSPLFAWRCLMLTLPIRTHSRTSSRNGLAQWLRDIVAGGRDGLAMQDRYEALSRLSEWELARRGLTRADFPRLVVTGKR